jgi:hypothetical protein
MLRLAAILLLAAAPLSAQSSARPTETQSPTESQAVPESSVEAAARPEPDAAAGASTPEVDPETGAVKQTPAGAIRFLDTLAQQGSLLVQYHYNTWPAYMLQYKVDRVTAPTECSAVFSGKPYGVALAGWPTYMAGTANFAYGMKEFAERYKHNPLPWTIDMSKVTSVTLAGLTAQHSNDQQTILVNGPFFVPLRLPDQALAKRVQYAITFLKEACDKTAETGF